MKFLSIVLMAISFIGVLQYRTNESTVAISILMLLGLIVIYLTEQNFRVKRTIGSFLAHTVGSLVFSMIIFFSHFIASLAQGQTSVNQGLSWSIFGVLGAIIWPILSLIRWFSRSAPPKETNVIDNQEKKKRRGQNLVVSNRTNEFEFDIEKPKRETGSEEISVSVGEETRMAEPQSEVRFTGVGPYSSDGVELQKGRYKIQFRFPKERSVFVKLVDTQDLESEEEIILWESGSGSKTFAVKKDGCYAFQIEPFMDMKNDTKWTIEFKRL